VLSRGDGSLRRIGGLPQALITTTAASDLDPALVAASSVWEVVPGSVRQVASP
jgi:hypothetical protein